MMIQGVSVGEMVNQSINVLTKPSIATFEQYERRGGQREALIYVGTAAAIGAAIALLAGVFTIGVVGGIVTGIFAGILPVAVFFLAATVIHRVGTSQGGTGSQDEVFYTIALYQAPILAISGVIGNIPLLSCLAAPLTFGLSLYGIYLGYLAVRSSMNLDQNKAIITMVVSWVVQMIVIFLIGAIVGVILAAVGAVPAGIVPPTP
ncbi:MAG: Yip1 family protein [Roseiflexaceae bacterium]